MSLSTLIEAAEFLEQQEKRKELQQLMSTTSPVTEPVNTIHQNIPTLTLSNKNLNLNQNGQTVVISSSNISLQGPLTLTTPVVKKEQDHQVSSTVMNPRHRVLNNSFDIMNPLVIDEASGQEIKRRQPPMAFRAGTREVHNKLEKHRRAHLKECFDHLKKQLPQNQDEKKTSNLSILHHALRYIQALKRKERELEHEMEKLAREKISAQQRLAVLKKELNLHNDNLDISKILPNVPTSTSITVETSKSDTVTTTTSVIQQNGTVNAEKVAIPLLAKNSVQVPSQTSITPIKEVSSSQPVQTTQLSVMPMSYPQGLVLQKVALVPKGLTELTPLMSTHFITTQQQLNGKVVPLQYVVKPVVVVSTASRPS